MQTTPTDDNRYAPPQAHVEDAAPGHGPGQLAGRGVRLGAVLIDTALLMAVFGIIAGLTPWNPFLQPPTGRLLQTTVVNTAGGVMIFLLINGWLLVRQGQTVGKRLLGLRIVRPGGGPVSPARLIGARYLVGWVAASLPFVGVLYGLVDSLLVFRESRRCLHDDIADTIVVRA